MRIKYPRTYHLPWSPGKTNDDKVLKSTKMFEGKHVVVLEKRDGENTTMYPDHIHARSIDSVSHYTRDYVKAIHGAIKHQIPAGWRICGENLHYTKSLKYTNLRAFFEVFSIWNEDNWCLGWDDTVYWAELMGLETVPELWRGEWDENFIKQLKVDPLDMEGYVVRLLDGFYFKDFCESVAKYVRPNHVQTDEHWFNQELKPNELG